MRKCYVVTEYGGEYEDKWETIIGIYLSKESAEKAKQFSENSRKYSGVYTDDFLDKLEEEVENYEQEHDRFFDSIEEGVLYLHPEYSKDENLLHDLQMRRNYFMDYEFTDIAEYELEE
jgi:hypothetical protein